MGKGDVHRLESVNVQEASVLPRNLHRLENCNRLNLQGRKVCDLGAQKQVFRGK